MYKLLKINLDNTIINKIEILLLYELLLSNKYVQHYNFYITFIFYYKQW